VSTFAAATVTLTTLDGVEHKVQVRVDGHQSLRVAIVQSCRVSLRMFVCTVPCARAEGRLRIVVS
jgi:hypothetical protein